MTINLRRLKAIILLESDTHYSFPFAEIIVSLLVVLTFYFMSDSPYSIYYVVVSSPIWNGTVIEASIEQWISTHAFRTSAGACYDMAFILAFLVPVLSALSFGRDLDTGITKTLLSYPVTRHQLFISKEVIILAITSGTVSVSYILALICFEPGPIQMEVVLLSLSSFWIPALLVSSTTALIGAKTKSLPASLFGGIALSFGMIIIPTIVNQIPTMLIAILNPGLVLVRYDFSSLMLESLLLGLITSLVISILMLLIAMKGFEKLEV